MEPLGRRHDPRLDTQTYTVTRDPVLVLRFALVPPIHDIGGTSPKLVRNSMTRSGHVAVSSSNSGSKTQRLSVTVCSPSSGAPAHTTGTMKSKADRSTRTAKRSSRSSPGRGSSASNRRNSFSKCGSFTLRLCVSLHRQHAEAAEHHAVEDTCSPAQQSCTVMPSHTAAAWLSSFPAGTLPCAARVRTSQVRVQPT